MVRQHIWAYLFCITSLFSCRKEETRWDTQIVAPLASGRLGVEDLIPDSLLQSEQGVWHLVFEESLTDINVDSLVTIPDTLFVQSYKSPFGAGSITLPAGATIFNISEDIVLNIPQASLRQIKIKSGTLEYKVKSFINGYMTSVYTLPGATLNGAPLQLIANTTPSTGDLPSEVSGIIDLTNYEINLTGANGFQTNSIGSTAVISVTQDAPVSAIISAQDSVVVELNFIEAKVAYAKGYFGQHAISFNEELDFFSGLNLPDGLLKLNQATLSLDVTNKIGVDASIDIGYLETLDENSISLSSLSESPLLYPLNISRAMDNNGEVIPSNYSVFINNTNSNLPQLIEQLPTAAKFNAQVFINPLGNISGSNDFIYTDRALEANMKLDIPLNIGLSGLTVRDTFEIKLEEELPVSGSIDIYFENGFPFSGVIQMALIDSLDQDYFPVVSDGFLAQGITDENQVVVTSTNTRLSVPVTPMLLNRLRKGYRIIVRAEFNTSNYPSTFPLLDSYYIDFKIVGNGNVEIEVN